MADEVNRLVNEIDVQEAEGARTRANSFQSFLKKKFGNPDGFSPRISATIDKVSVNNTTKTFKQLTKNWDNIRRHTHTGLFKFGFMKDKREMTDVNKFFGKLEIKAMEAIRKYNEQLKALESNDTKTGAIDTINKKLDLYERKLERIKKIEEHWANEKAHWEDVQNSLAGTDTLEQVKGRRTKLQAEKNKLSNEIKKKQDKAFSSQRNQNNIQSGMQDASARFDLAANKAAAVKWQFGKEGTGDKVDPNYNWKRITDYVKGMNEDNATKRNELEQLQAEMVDEEHTLYSLYNKAKEDFKENGTEANKTFVDTVKNDLDTLRINLQGVESQLDQLAVKEKLAQAYQKSINKARATKGADHASWKGGGDDLNRSAGWDFAQAGKMEKAVFNNIVEDTIPDQYLDGLKQKRAEIQKEIDGLNDDMAQARINDKAKLDAKQHIEEADGKLKKAADMTDATTKATVNWNNELVKTNDEIKHIHEQLQLVLKDMQINPIQVEMKADALQPLNHEADELNRKWGVMGSLVDKIKAKLNGVKGYMRQINPLSKLWHKIVLNTYSQIASFLNPLNIIKRSMSSFLDRFDNKDWANTFDVIKYNLVTAIAPILEKILMIGLKLAAVANVFTKKWAGVDLFDKAAWQTEQMKKNVGAMTASFDELHASNENPNALNTVFDTGRVNKDNLISPELETKLGEWADKIGTIFGKVKDAWNNVWEFIKKHPILSAIIGITAAALLSKLGLTGIIGTLAGWALKGAGKIVKAGWEGIKWLGPKIWTGLKWCGAKVAEYAPKIFHSLKIGALKAASKIETIWNKSTYAIGNFLNKGLYTGMNGATVTMGKFLGGVALVGGGVALAGTQAAKAGKNWQDYNGWQKAGAIGAVGLGSAAAGLGAVMLGASGPVGWAVAGAVALGSFVIGMGKVQDGIGSVKDEQEKWATAQQNLSIAMQNVETATNNYAAELSNLETLEQQTGLSGKTLYDQVQNGTLAVDNMTSSQLAVYNAYTKTKEAMDTLKQAQADKQKYEKEEAEGMIRTALAARKKKDDYTEAKDAILKAVEEEKISTEEAADYFSRLMGNMKQDARDALMEEIPEDIRQCVEPTKYASGWEKFGIGWNNFWGGVWEGTKGLLGDIGNGIKGAWDGISGAVGKVWDGMKTTAGNIWNSIKIEAGEAWDGIKNSAIGQKVQDIWSNAKTKFEDLKTKAGEKWQQIKDTAGKKWDEIKNSAIGQKVQDIYSKTKSKFDEIKNNLSSGWNTLKTNASNAWNNIKNSIVNGAKSAWEGAKGFFSKIGEGIKSAWEGLKGFVSNTGQKIGNFFGGNGFKTDSEVEEYRKKNNINSYAVGTNYVPNDQLAYIHQGEAIIPKKYNKPYNASEQSNAQTTNAIMELTNRVAQLQEMVNQGIPIHGEFRQRGNDLVATVERITGKNSNKVLNNKVYAR